MKLRERAEQMLANETAGYVAAAIADPDAPIDAARLKRIEALRETVACLPRSAAPERLLAASIVAISLLAAVAVWWWRVSSVDFTADLTARQLAVLNTTNVLANASIRGKGVHFENGARIWGFNLAVDTAGEPRDLEGDTMWLNNLRTEGKGLTEIKPSPDGLDVVVSDGVMRGTLLMRPNPSAPFDSADFEAVGTAGRPAIVHVAAASLDPIDVIASTQPTDFLLTEQATLQDSAQMFRSAITGGTMTIPVGSRKLTLHLGDVVRLRGIRLRWAELTVDKAIRLSVEGSGTEVQAGPQTAIEDLRPTMLQAIMESKSAKLLWGAVLFICGLLWNIRKFLPGGSVS